MCALGWYAGQDPACTAVGYAQLVAVSSCAGDVVYRYRDRYQAAQVQVQVQVQVWPNNFNAYSLHQQGQPLYCWEESFPLFGRRRWWGKDYLLTSELAFTAERAAVLEAPGSCSRQMSTSALGLGRAVVPRSRPRKEDH